MSALRRFLTLEKGPLNEIKHQNAYSRNLNVGDMFFSCNRRAGSHVCDSHDGGADFGMKDT